MKLTTEPLNASIAELRILVLMEMEGVTILKLCSVLWELLQRAIKSVRVGNGVLTLLTVHCVPMLNWLGGSYPSCYIIFVLAFLINLFLVKKKRIFCKCNCGN